MKSELKAFATAIVAKDKKLGTNDIVCFPIEHMADHDGTVTDEETMNQSVNDQDMGITQSTIKKEVNLKAQWLNLGSSNRITAPDVKKGETVKLYKYGNSDVYYWTTMFTETDLRRKEAVLHVYGNEEEFGKQLDKKNSYWTLVDTVNQKVQLHTSNNSGEVTTYDINLDTKAGVLEIVDGNKNTFHLNSKSGTLTIRAKTIIMEAKETTFKGGHVTFNSTVDFNKKTLLNNHASTTDGATVV